VSIYVKRKILITQYSLLVVKEDGVRMLPVDQDTTYDRIVDTVPQILDIIKSLVKDLCKKNKNNNSGNTTNVENNSTQNTPEENYTSDNHII